MIMTGSELQFAIAGLCVGVVLGAVALGWVLSR